MLNGNDRQKAIRETEDKIGAMLRNWEQGKATSSDERDYVSAAREVLTKRDPEFIGTTPEGEEFVADVMFDKAEEFSSRRAMASFLVDELQAE